MFQDKNNAKPKTGISGLFDKAKNYVTDLKTTIGGSDAPENASQENAPQEPAKQDNTQEQPNAPLGATWQDRIKNATASDDDIRKAAEEYKAGRYTPGPKTLEEFKKMGLLDEQEQQTTVPDNAQTAPEQPAAETPEQTQTQTPDVADNAGSNDVNNVNNGNAAGNATVESGAPEQTAQTTPTGDKVTPATEEKKEGMLEEIKHLSDDDMKSIYDSIDNAEYDKNKAQIAGIFDAYKNEQIDKNQRNYFLADAIARFANNIGEIQDAKNQNALWANITSGNQKSANVDLSPNEWQSFLKTDWQEAQKRKNEAKQKALHGNIDNVVAAAKEQGNDYYLMNTLPTMAKNSTFRKMDPDEQVQVSQTIANCVKGNVLNGDQLGAIGDPKTTADKAGKITDLTIESMVKGNEMQGLLNYNQSVVNEYEKQRQDAEMRYKNNEISLQEKDKILKDLDAKTKQLDNSLNEQLNPLKVSAEQVKQINDKFGSMKLKLGAGPLASKFVDAGLEMNVANLVHMFNSLKGAEKAEAMTALKSAGVDPSLLPVLK